MKILGTLNINGNQEGFQLSLPDVVAVNTMSLYEEAKNTVLRDVEEEEHSKIFDPWLKKKDPSLYKVVMTEFMSELHIRLQEGIAFNDGDECGLEGVLPPIGIDDSFWWPESQNTIEIESLDTLKK